MNELDILMMHADIARKESRLAWELQTHMHDHVAPSLHKYAQQQDDPNEWLVTMYVDQRTAMWGEDNVCPDTGTHARSLSYDALLDMVAERAIEHGTTTNGGHEVYLDSHTSIPWCSEDELHEWFDYLI